VLFCALFRSCVVVAVDGVFGRRGTRILAAARLGWLKSGFDWNS
jgi:hypothetical protein